MNPYHPDTPKYRAFDRLRTMRVAPDVPDDVLQEIIDETYEGLAQHAQDEGAERAREAARRLFARRFGQAENKLIKAGVAVADAQRAMKGLLT